MGGKSEWGRGKGKGKGREGKAAIPFLISHPSHPRSSPGASCSYRFSTEIEGVYARGEQEKWKKGKSLVAVIEQEHLHIFVVFSYALRWRKAGLASRAS